MNNALHFSSETDKHATPQAFFDLLNEEFNFVLDVCADSSNAKCKTFYTEEIDGLSQDWHAAAEYLGPLEQDSAIWMNPPYQRGERKCKAVCKKKKCIKRGHIAKDIPGMDAWVYKAWKDSSAHHPIVCLLPARTDSRWFHKFVWDRSKNKPYSGVELRFIKGRLKFGNPKNKNNSAPFPSIIVVFRRGQ